MRVCNSSRSELEIAQLTYTRRRASCAISLLMMRMTLLHVVLLGLVAAPLADVSTGAILAEDDGTAANRLRVTNPRSPMVLTSDTPPGSAHLGRHTPTERTRLISDASWHPNPRALLHLVGVKTDDDSQLPATKTLVKTEASSATCAATSACLVGTYCTSLGTCDTCAIVLINPCDEKAGDCCSQTFLHNCPLGGMKCPHCPAAPATIGNSKACAHTAVGNTCDVKCKFGDISHATNCTCKPGGTWPTWECTSVASCPSQAPGSVSWVLGLAGESCLQACQENDMVCKAGTSSPGQVGLEAIALKTAPLACGMKGGEYDEDKSNIAPYAWFGTACYYSPGTIACDGSDTPSHDPMCPPDGCRRFCPCVVDCIDIKEPLHGSAGNCPPNHNLQDGHSCTPKCISGYTLTGDLSCAAGVLTDTATCNPNSCDVSSPAPLHGSPGTCTSTLLSGDSCVPHCDPGYQLEGQRSCLAGQLTDNVRCMPKPCGRANENLPTHGTAGKCPPVLESSKACEIDCTNGFKRTGSRRCLLGNLTDTTQCKPCDKQLCGGTDHGVCTDSGTTCNCTEGWFDSPKGRCSGLNDLCTVLRPCSSKDIKATCNPAVNHNGYECNCSDGYASSAEPGVNCDRVVYKGSCGKLCWETICIIATVVSVLPVPYMIRRFKRSFRSLHDPQLPEERRHLGPFGLFLFCFGVADLVLDVVLCFTLHDCDQVLLLWCAIITLVVTTGMTWHLGYYSLKNIVRNDSRDDKPAKAWLVRNPTMGPLVVLLASSRLNSMAILRLKIGGNMWTNFDDAADHRYFHFLRNAGMYHFCKSTPQHRSHCSLHRVVETPFHFLQGLKTFHTSS